MFFDDVKVPAREPRPRGRQGLDGGQVPARLRAHGHRPHRSLQARAGAASRSWPRTQTQDGKPLHRRPALPRPPHARGGRADGAGDHQPALPRPDAPERQASGRRRLACSRSRAPRSSRRITELMMQAAGPLAQAYPPGGHRWTSTTSPRGWPALLQHAQGHHLRRLQRDPAEHHREGDARGYELLSFSEEQQLLADSLRKYLTNDYLLRRARQDRRVADRMEREDVGGVRRDGAARDPLRRGARRLRRQRGGPHAR